MLPAPEPACLVIADISGYTDYLAGVELDHAQDILADLIDRVVKALRPPFKLAKLEGDAAFVYALTDTVDSSLMQDTIEGAYFAFRRRVRDIRQASSCECDACRRIPTLDLKFVVHHGVVAKQKMAGRDELVGRDVILVHRLLKNAASAKVRRTRLRALYRPVHKGDGRRSDGAEVLAAQRDDRRDRRGHSLGEGPRGGVARRA